MLRKLSNRKRRQDTFSLKMEEFGFRSLKTTRRTIAMFKEQIAFLEADKS
jgi:hypothetical protein